MPEHDNTTNRVGSSAPVADRGVPPSDLHPTRFDGEVWSCQVPEDPFARVSSDGRCPKCRIASEARLRFWQAQR